VFDPAEFDAVTATRTVDPTSPEVNAYDCAAAAVISLQFAPPESQRRH
jgi:hypothetical protein